jgi:hypothetical protein
MSQAMSELERAVYDLADAGALDAQHTPLYARAIGRLVARGLVVRGPDGTVRAVRAATDTRPPRAGSVHPPALPREEPAPSVPPEPAPEPQGVLVVRVPQSWLDLLDSRGESRSAAVRAILGRALAAGSGARRRSA